MSDDPNPLRSLVEAIAATETPPAPKPPRGLAEWLPAPAPDVKSRVLVAVGDKADEYTNAAMRAWSDDVKSVIPLRTSTALRVERLTFHRVLAHLACPLVDLSCCLAGDDRDNPSNYNGAAFQNRERAHQKSRRRLSGHLAMYGGEHTESRMTHLDVEAYAIELERSGLATLQTPAVFMRFVDDLLGELAQKTKTDRLAIVVQVIGLDTHNVVGEIGTLSRAAKVLRHERVVFVATYPVGSVAEIQWSGGEFVVCGDAKSARR